MNYAVLITKSYGSTPMPDKSNFAPDEWKLLLESVMMASIAITAAEPRGFWGLLQESFAGGTELAKAKMDPGADALIKAVVADFGTAEGRTIARDGLKEKFTDSKPAGIKAKCIETLRQVAEVVDAKAPADATAFKTWLRQISQHVELCGILGDEVDQAAWFAGTSMTSMPFSNLTPAMTFGN